MRRLGHFPKWRARSVRHAKKRPQNTSSVHHARLVFEALEVRALLSVAVQLPVGWEAQPSIKADFLSGFNSAGSSTPYGLTPSQIRGAYYGQGILGNGSGETIAIVDAYDDPNALNDLNAFSTYFGLPTFGGSGAPTFKKLDQNGGTSLPGTDPTGPWSTTGNTTWETEESLDIEWAHVMAPMANIVLVEAANAGSGLYTAVQSAENIAGVVAISMSWSGSEFRRETADDPIFVASGVTFLAAAGDSGAYASGTSTITPQYPACSPNVVAVGGTSLTVNADNSYGSETSWGNGTSSGTAGGGGGGISVYESQPSYQSGVVNAYSTKARTYPDVSADANPSTGVPIYDSWDFGTSTPWVPGTMGGTSLACPLWAGMIAVVDQERAIAGLGSLSGAGQTLPELYQVYQATPTDFHDITSGNSIGGATYAPQTGYDLATGLGSPVGASLVPALVGVAAPTVTGISPTAGPLGGGTSVTITGTNLTDAMAVNFGGTAVTTFISDTGTQIVLNSPAGGAGTVDVTVVTPGGTSATSTADQFSYLAAPTVTNVLVSSTNWSSTFLSSLASLSSRNVGGYSIPVGGGAQLATLPWGNINQIEVVFSENVTVNQADLLLSGVNTTAYNVSGGTFSYNPNTFTATWTLPQAIGPDKLMLALNADGSDPIEDAAGDRLDGEWTNPTSTSDTGGSTYPSGNGVAGGDFDFRFNVLPGDANQDGSANFSDLSRLLANYGTSTGESWGQGDFNGDGAVNFTDLSELLAQYGQSLPSGEPAAGMFPAGDLLVAATMPTTVNSKVTVSSQAGVIANVAVADNRGPEGPDVLAAALPARPALVQNKAPDVFHASAATPKADVLQPAASSTPTALTAGVWNLSSPPVLAAAANTLSFVVQPAVSAAHSSVPGKNATNLERTQDQVASALADRVRAHDAVLTGLIPGSKWLN